VQTNIDGRIFSADKYRRANFFKWHGVVGSFLIHRWLQMQKVSRS